MTDNEKRAHDLSVALCVKVLDMKEKEAVSLGKNLDFDFYKEYMTLYNQNLKLFNRDFPDGK